MGVSLQCGRALALLVALSTSPGNAQEAAYPPVAQAEPSEPAPTETPPLAAPPVQPPSADREAAPNTEDPSVPSTGEAAQPGALAAQPGSPPPGTPPSYGSPVSEAGQWVYTEQYGWLWMPYAQSYSYVVEDDVSDAYMFVFDPALGWRWVGAPWILGVGPAPYWGVRGRGRFAFYAHPWFRPRGDFGRPPAYHGGGPPSRRPEVHSSPPPPHAPEPHVPRGDGAHGGRR